jgi:molybdopterin-guanine dinucleotide biosynthesis protein
MQGILEIIGPKGTGKTTLASLVGQEFSGQELSGQNILLIDASPNLGLTTQLAIQPGQTTLSQLARTLAGQDAPQNTEALDWSFHDLILHVRGELDLVILGSLPTELPQAVEKQLAYGLGRLLEHYDYVVIDGFHERFRQWLPEELLRTLIVLTPDNELKDTINWDAIDPSKTQPVIINRTGSGKLPEALETLIEDRNLNLVGKLPEYTTQEDRIRELPAAFHNCVLRLNLPLKTISG